MDNQYNQKDISLDLLLDYVFKKLTPQKEKALEDFLDKNETYNDLVDGIFNYCLSKNITSKIDLEKDLDANEASFFTKFPDLVKLNLEDKKPPKTNWKKNGFGLILILLFLVGPFLVWKIGNTPNAKEQNNSKEIQQEPTTIDPTFEPQKEETDSQKIEENSNDSKIENGKNNKNKTQENDQKNNQKPMILADVAAEIEKINPLNSSASNYLENEIEVRGSNSRIEEAEQLLAQGKPTQKTFYILGLHELSKDPPVFKRAIELLSQVQQQEFPGATWFLFRAYLLDNNLEQAKIEFQKMQFTPAIQKYYEASFLKILPPSTKAFFQSNDN